MSTIIASLDIGGIRYSYFKNLPWIVRDFELVLKDDGILDKILMMCPQYEFVVCSELRINLPGLHRLIPKMPDVRKCDDGIIWAPISNLCYTCNGCKFAVYIDAINGIMEISESCLNAPEFYLRLEDLSYDGYFEPIMEYEPSDGIVKVTAPNTYNVLRVVLISMGVVHKYIVVLYNIDWYRSAIECNYFAKLVKKYRNQS